MRQEQESSQSRLRAAAKALFAERGYEATSIGDITRAAKTSHSQFLKYYASKEDVRREIVDLAWSELSRALVLAMASVPSPKEKLRLALNMLVSFLDNDSQFRTIFLLESTATRDSSGELLVSSQFRQVIDILDEVLSAMESDGELLPGTNKQVARSALLGAIEGMMRDPLLSKAELPAGYSVEEVRSMVASIIDAISDIQRPALVGTEAVLGRSSEDEWIRYYLKLGDTVLGPSELS
jgi:TetR/AcrR family transcriptional regulator of autoinduction and epiphytic fitness